MIRFFHRFEEWVIALVLASMTVVTFVQVIARYFFHYSITWALELSMFLFGALIFLGMSYGVRVYAHIGVDALVKNLPQSLARLIGIVICLVCMVYSVLIFYGSWQYLMKMYLIGINAQDLPIPRWVPIAVVPIGYALLFIRLFQVLIRMIRGLTTHLLGDEAEDALKMMDEDEIEELHDKIDNAQQEANK